VARSHRALLCLAAPARGRHTRDRLPPDWGGSGLRSLAPALAWVVQTPKTPLSPQRQPGGAHERHSEVAEEKRERYKEEAAHSQRINNDFELFENKVRNDWNCQAISRWTSSNSPLSPMCGNTTRSCERIRPFTIHCFLARFHMSN
jgi:hypothetical protein